MANIDIKELENLPTAITEVENPEVYSKDINHINKPIKNIKFGHLLNINWDNLAGAFTLIRKFLAEAIYRQNVDNKNTAGKIVCRNADKSIEVGDIYCSSKTDEEPNIDNVALAFLKDGRLAFSTNKDLLRDYLQLNKDGIVQDIRMAGKVETYAHAPLVNGYVVTRYNRSGDRGGGYITQRTLQKKINGTWYIVDYYEGVIE